MDHLTRSRQGERNGQCVFLNKEIPFYQKDKRATQLKFLNGLEPPVLREGFIFTYTNTAKCHGLPLLGFVDWNDTVVPPNRC
ncbi:hypothetical protein O9993_16170 [Vibrio lentus]|nr:hypothetical protein [Vibrio lentus]